MKKIIFIFLFIILYPKNNHLYNKQNNVVGNIYIPDTTINYKIYQTKDNKYYLNHKDNKKNKYGSIFLDYRNKLNDKKLIIYDNNSKNIKNIYFKELENYKDYNFYKNNKYINITINNNNYLYKIFSINIIPKDNYYHTKIKFSDNEFLEHINYLKNNSIYNTHEKVLKKDYIITIQTCNYNPDNTYLLINAKRVDNNEKISV